MRLVTICALAALFTSYASASPADVTAFEAFKSKYHRSYSSAAEEAKRFKIFTENMRKADELQAVNPHASFGASVFADLSEAEFKVRHNSQNAYRKAMKATSKLETLSFSAAEKASVKGESMDWRAKGAVTPVKNQGQCGSCWSFSTTGGIEGQWFLAGNTLTSVSEQELVSCDTIDSGCNGGLMDNAFTWLLQATNGTIVTEQSYPYVSGNGEVPACDKSGKTFGARISSYKNIGKTEADMSAFVFKGGPLSVAVDAESWQTYIGGIMTNCVAGQLDHGVLIVGFDMNNNPPYWIVKNSWGESWGENGYIRVEYGTGQCSLGQYQTTAIVSGGPTPAPTPAPSGPTPAPTGAQFVQKTCLDNVCSSECSEQSFPLGDCVRRGNTSFTAVCATDAVIIASYTTADCKGIAVYTANAKDTCSVVFDKAGNEHFVENVCRNAPSHPPITPRPVAPTPPPTTAAPSGGGTFTQMQCQDSQCSVGCQSNSFAQNTCLQLNGGGSAIAVCQPTQLMLTIYSSSDCSGQGQSSGEPINQCLADNTGSYLENICSNNSTIGALQSAGLVVPRH